MRNASVAPIEEAKETITVPQSSPKTAPKDREREHDDGEDDEPGAAHGASAVSRRSACPGS